MDILAIVNDIALSPEGQLRVIYTACAIDRATLKRALWGGSIDIDITATASQIATTVTNGIKTAAPDNIGEPVPGNARVKVLGV
jgi:hypothetical protein